MKFSQKDIQKKAESALRACLLKVPFLNISATEQDIPVTDFRLDILATVSIGQKQRRIALEVTGNGQPRMVRTAAYQLQRYQQNAPDTYCMIVAPYISPQAADICTKEGIGYLDLAGNCRINFDQVYIEQTGNSNPFTQKRDLRSLYSPKAARVLRVLLNEPQRPWKVQPLAKEASVSLGQVSNVKKILEDREWLSSVDAGFMLSDPEQLLAEWAEYYDFRKNIIRNYYSLRSVTDIEADLAVTADELRIPYALAGFSAAARFAPSVRYQRAMIYVADGMEEIVKKLSLKEVNSGANVTLVTPYDEGILYGSRVIDGIRVTSPVQTYIDLLGNKGRGEEAATTILDEVIRKSW
jgi:hypothetical protein